MVCRFEDSSHVLVPIRLSPIGTPIHEIYLRRDALETVCGTSPAAPHDCTKTPVTRRPTAALASPSAHRPAQTNSCAPDAQHHFCQGPRPQGLLARPRAQQQSATARQPLIRLCSIHVLEPKQGRQDDARPAPQFAKSRSKRGARSDAGTVPSIAAITRCRSGRRLFGNRSFSGRSV